MNILNVITFILITLNIKLHYITKHEIIWNINKNSESNVRCELMNRVSSVLILTELSPPLCFLWAHTFQFFNLQIKIHFDDLNQSEMNLYEKLSVLICENWLFC